MKKIFIYYSRTGSGKVVADYLKEKGYDIRKVIPKKEIPSNLFLSMMTGGFKALLNKKDKLVDFNNDISKYDKVVIGGPIWNDRLSSPINAVLSELDLNDKDVTFVLYSASGVANAATKKINSLYKGDNIVLKSPKNHEEELDKIKKL